MYKFLQIHGKKILAILGVFLMVAFIIPPAAKYGTTRTRRVVGRIGSQKVYSDEVAEAREEWELLMNRLGQEGQRLIIGKMGINMAIEVQRRPELFFLLEQEARRAGIVVNDDLVNTILTNQLMSSGFLRAEQQTVSRNAVRHLIEIGVLHDRLASSVKISEPMLVREGTPNWESVRLNLVTLSTADAGGPTTAPATQQVQEQFAQFKNVQASSLNRPASDPLGFGYQVPNRVKLQYIALPHKSVADAVRAGKSVYDWDVSARMYYAEHSDEFVRSAPETQPSTAPSTQPATMASTEPSTRPAVAATQPSSQPTTVAAAQPATVPTVATSGPSTRPFAEVKEEIVEKLIAPDVDKLEADITAAIAQRLNGGWLAYQASPGAVASPSTQPTTAASTGPTTYDAYGFLENIAADIQGRFKVLPEVRQLGEWADANQLAKEPGIGAGRTADSREFAPYATEDAIAFNPTTQPAGAKQLHLLEPSQVLSDTTHDNYIFRLTAVSPAHAPDLQEIYARVEEDTRTRAQYQNAQAEARKLLADAQKQSLSAAAVATHRVMTSTGNFRLSQRMIPNFIASPAAVEALVGKARALLEEATPEHPHPAALVEMPGDRKVVVAELADVSLDAGDSELFQDKLAAFAGEELRQVEQLAQKWFSYDAVVARLGYKADVPDKDQATSGQ